MAEAKLDRTTPVTKQVDKLELTAAVMVLVVCSNMCANITLFGKVGFDLKEKSSSQKRAMVAVVRREMHVVVRSK